MVGEQLRDVGGVFGRWGALYPAIVASGGYLASSVVGVRFGTVLFAIFIGAVVVTGIGAWHTSPMVRFVSTAWLSGIGWRPEGGPTDPRSRWTDSILVRLALFDLGLAVVLSVHALLWMSAN